MGIKSHCVFLSDVLLAPLVTEKSTFLRERGVYAFKVARLASKRMIGKSFEKRFSVKVDSVRIVCVKQKIKSSMLSRSGKAAAGKTSSYKKAYISVIGKEKISELDA